MKIKHILRLALALISLLLALPASAYDFEKDGLYYNILSETTVECCGGGQSPSDATYRKTDVIIPSTVQRGLKSYTVVKIADYAWGQVQYIVWIKNIVLPETITEIGVGAFRDATNIESINLPEGLKIIGDYAMQGPKLAEYIFPKSLESIGTRAFNSSLKSVVFTSAIAPSIKEETFAYQNGGIYDIFIPSGFKMYVPDMDAYASVPYYLSYLSSICSFDSNTFIYSGNTPNLSYSFDLPNSHNLTVNLDNLPFNAGYYDLVLMGKIDGLTSIEIPLKLSISKTELKITAKDFSRDYGEDNPLLTAEISGLVKGEHINNALTNGYELYTTATAQSDIGDYPILLKSDISENYTVTFHQGKMNIKKASISINVDNCSREYGIDNPRFSINYHGLKNGEQIPKWDKSPAFSTDATKYSNVGIYPISVVCEPHNYEITSNTTGTLTITPASLIITANNCQREYSEENPQYTFSLSGLRNNDDASCLSKQPIFDCVASINSDCGEYSITPNSAESQNYSISYKPGVLTITKAPLTLMAYEASREYGEENPILGFRANGLKGSDTQDSALQQLPSLSTSALVNSSVGEYPISITGGSSKNYTLSYRSGILTITKAPLSVLANNAERIYGYSNPAFMRSYMGFKLSDTESIAFSVLPRIECSATKTSDVGEYPIIVSGGISRNYEIVAYENGILTVIKSKATISANNKSRLYFEENPQFDFSVAGLLNGDTKSCLTTLPSYKCDANILSNVGNYQIVPTDADAKNYIFEYVPGNLTINKRQLTASVGNYSRAFGEDNPNFEINYNGFVNNEDQSVLTESATISCSATSLSDVGSYPIEIVGGDATNYRISQYNYGILTITKASQSVIWNQDLSNIELYSQVELTATSDANLPITYEMSPNNVATLYSNSGKWYLDCFGSGAVNIRAVQNGDKNHNAANLVSKTLVVYGGGDDPQNPQIYLNIEEAGTLSSMIADNRKYQIKNLRLTGYLNGTDINFLREMAGSDSNGNTTPGVLETLDISGCTIVAGGRSYYKSSRTSDCVVGDYMFYNCKVLTTLHLPNNSTMIGNSSLADCDRLSVVSIPNSVKKFGAEAFRNDISLLRIPMPEFLTTIDDMAFMGCNGLTEITIPSEVSVIGDGIVKDCENIARINVYIGNSNFASVDGVLFNNSLDELIIFPVNHQSNDYVVADGVKTIAPYAFVNAKGLKVVSLPSTLTTIGQNAFIGCVNLQTLKIRAITPPICQNDCFESVSKTRCELQVPLGCRSSYWVAPVWSEFNKIVETDFSGIEDVYYGDLQIGIINGKISVSGCPEDMTVRIYQINGTLLYQGWPSNGVVQFEPSSNGVYIVMIGNKAYKLMVK